MVDGEYGEAQRNLQSPFIKLKKAKVTRGELRVYVRMSGVAEKHDRVVENTMENIGKIWRTALLCAVDITEEFKVEMGLHQGAALSPFWFTILTG